MDTPEVRTIAEPNKGYALSGKIMLSAIIILFAVVVFMVGLHLYARWYLVGLRRRQIERRRQRRGGRTHVVLYADSRAAADRGLALSVINSLPYFMYSPKSEQPPLECAVCLSEFEEKEIVRLLPKCSHNFHLDCIDMWFQSHSTCPLCRSAVEEVSEPTRPVEEGNGTEPCSSLGSGSEFGLCATCHHHEASGNANENNNSNTTSLGDRRKGFEVRIEVPPRNPSELTQCSPSSRLLSLKRMLSMGIRSPRSGARTPSGAGPSGTRTPGGVGPSGTVGLDLESGPIETTQDPSKICHSVEVDLENQAIEMTRESSRFKTPV